MLKLILEWIAEYIISRRWVCSRPLHLQALGEIFQVDAKAEDNDVVLGSWCVGKGFEHSRGRTVFAAARSWFDHVGLRKEDLNGDRFAGIAGGAGRSNGVCPLPTAGSGGSCSLWLFSGHRR